MPVKGNMGGKAGKQRSVKQKLEALPAFEIEWLDPATLEPHPENPKVHGGRQQEELAASLQEFGWLRAPIWNRRTGRLVDGHARREEALRARVPRIPVRVIDVDEDTERRILASFDRVGELRSYDERAVRELLEVCQMDDARPLPGWSQDELNDLLALDPEPVRSTKSAPSGSVPDATIAAGSQPSAQSAGSEEQPEPQRSLDGVRMVQLFFDGEEHARFEARVVELADTYGLNTPSDVVLQALRSALEEGDE